MTCDFISSEESEDDDCVIVHLQVGEHHVLRQKLERKDLCQQEQNSQQTKILNGLSKNRLTISWFYHVMYEYTVLFFKSNI